MNLHGKVHYIDFSPYNLGETTMTGIAATTNDLNIHSYNMRLGAQEDKTVSYINILIELGRFGAAMPNSPHRAPPAAENASSTNSGCAGFDDRLKIRHISPFALQQQWKRIIIAAFVLMPEPDSIKTCDPEPYPRSVQSRSTDLRIIPEIKQIKAVE